MTHVTHAYPSSSKNKALAFFYQAAVHVFININKMRKAFADRAKLPAMAQKGREMVMQKFTYQHLVDIYEDVYSRLVK